jgi:MFS family permease
MKWSEVTAFKKIGKALPALKQRNFRLYWSGQVISLVGTQMQMVAMGWLVYRISDSLFYLELINALATLPILLFAMFAGMIADRVSKRNLLIALQAAFLIHALALAFLVSSGRAAVWNLMVLAIVQGIITAFEAPTRQSFVSEMVPQETVMSAVALNSTVFNGARIIGPAIAGFLIHKFSEAECFYINAASFAAIIVGLSMMRESDLFRTMNHAGGNGLKQMKDGIDYVRRDRRMLGLLVSLVAISIFGMPAMVLLPAFAKTVFHTGPKGMGFLYAALGAGAIVSTVTLSFTKNFRRQGVRIFASGIFFALAMIAFSQCRNYHMSLFLIALAGTGMTAAVAMTNSTLQMLAPPELRGRVMGIYIMVFLGMMPVGSFIVGFVAKYLDARDTATLCGAACLSMIVLVGLLLKDTLRIDAASGNSDTHA